jgi:hypothetical protein
MPNPLEGMFNNQANANKAYIGHSDKQLKEYRAKLQAELLRLNECSRLKHAKQVVFDFAEPAEDWGTTTK